MWLMVVYIIECLQANAWLTSSFIDDYITVALKKHGFKISFTITFRRISNEHGIGV